MADINDTLDALEAKLVDALACIRYLKANIVAKDRRIAELEDNVGRLIRNKLS